MSDRKYSVVLNVWFTAEDDQGANRRVDDFEEAVRLTGVEDVEAERPEEE